MAQLEALMQRHFVDYASYFILDRAIPDIRDGLKPVQRRLLYTLSQMDDGRYHKVANIIGETMKLHPHGDVPIADALVVLANKDYFIDRQGNFGNIITGHPAAAARYIECRLTPLARETLFNDALTEFLPSYDGRTKEPVFLPSKLPVALMLGTEGIAVGMATRILPHNLTELWQAQIDLLRGKKVELLPDFPQGGSMDASAYADGRGKVEVRAEIEARGDHRVVIREIPYSTTTESLIASIESAAQRGRIKVASIQDYTAEHVEIELTLTRGSRPDQVIPQLYAYTDCAVSVNSNLIVVNNRRPVQLTVTEVLKSLTEDLTQRIKAELEYERAQLLDRHHWLVLEQIFIEERVYRRLEGADTETSVRDEVVAGMEPFARRFVRPLEDTDVTRLLDLRIRRISRYDLERNRRDIEAVLARLEKIESELRQLKRTTIRYVQDLLKRYGPQYPRRTRIDTHETIDKKAVAQQSIKLAYDPETGFFGSAVRGDSFKLQISEFDLVLALTQDGVYRVLPAIDKILFESPLLHCARFDPEAGEEFIVVYRDAKRIPFAKRVQIKRFIRSREYELIKGREGQVDMLLRPEQAQEIVCHFASAPRQKVKEVSFDLRTLDPVGVSTRGSRLASKPVRRIEFASEAAARSAGSKRTKKTTSVSKSARRKTSSAKETKRAAAKQPTRKKSGAKGTTAKTSKKAAKKTPRRRK